MTTHQLDVINQMTCVAYFSRSGKYKCRQKFVGEIHCKLHWKLKYDLSGSYCWENEAEYTCSQVILMTDFMMLVFRKCVS